MLGVIGGTLENYFMNPNAWNLQGYTGFVWGGCAWLVFIWAYFRLPETKVSPPPRCCAAQFTRQMQRFKIPTALIFDYQGRTFHELDILFAKEVPARKFATTNIDEFDEVENTQLVSKYAVDGGVPQRPSFVPSIMNVLGSHARADDANADIKVVEAGAR